MSVIVAATPRSRHPCVHVFANTVIAIDDRFGNAKPDRIRTQEQAGRVVRPLLDEGKTGHDRVHRRRTGWLDHHAGRGGSDYSATLLGAALMADEVQIWTDAGRAQRRSPPRRGCPCRSPDQFRRGPGARAFRREGAPSAHDPAGGSRYPCAHPVDLRSKRAWHAGDQTVDRPAPESHHGHEQPPAATVDVPELEDLQALLLQYLSAACGPGRCRACLAGFPPLHDVPDRQAWGQGATWCEAGCAMHCRISKQQLAAPTMWHWLPR